MKLLQGSTYQFLKLRGTTYYVSWAGELSEQKALSISVVMPKEEQVAVSILLCVSGFLIVVLVYLIARRQRIAFEERFPPISEAEFIARCKPGTRPEVALKVRRIVADALGVEYERIYPSSRFVEDLGAD